LTSERFENIVRKANSSVIATNGYQNVLRVFLVLTIMAIGITAYLSSQRLRVVEALSVTTLDVPITQNFDTLPASGSATFVNDTTLPGWYSARTGTGTTIVANDGSSNAGNLYSYGTGTNTDRALGSLGSGNAAIGNLFWGIVLTNNTGATITSLDVAYNGEQWRNSAAAAQTVAFSYNTGASFTGSLAEFQAAGTNVTQLDFTSPITGGAAGALNGNLAANRTAISFTISGLSLAAGQSIFLRWSDPDHTGADHGLAIDDFSVTPHGGVTTPTLNIGDVTMAEGNAGMTAFTFNVSLTGGTAPGGGVSFNASTQDGTAVAPGDYTAFTNQPGSISAGGTSTTVTVQVNGDLTTEANETFFVNLTNIVGANAGDVQGLGTINNDDVSTIAIHDIQGNGSTSPLVSTSVTTTGIVTGTKSNGFFLQTPDAGADADPNTSEGIFVFTSSAPPGSAAIGNAVNVTGTVQEFIPSADPPSPPMTELISPTVVLLSSGNPLPAAITITASETTQASETANPLDSLEEYEGMRVTVGSLTVTGPTQGTINEPNATVSSSGVFIGVVTGVARPFREAGIAISDPLPAGAPVTIPRFDENPERIRVDSDAQPGTTALDVAAGTVITGLTGPLDYGFRTYTIDPDAATPPIVGAPVGSTPVPVPTADEFTVASFNMERFFDTTDAPGIGDPVLTATAFNRRLAKASLIIRTVERYPDVIGVQEMENLTTLQSVAAQVNSDAQTIDLLPNPNYVAYLVEGNDPGGIDVGFLVKESRITTVNVTQFGLADTFTNPDMSTSTLNDRPPLVLRATCPRTGPGGGSLPFTVIVNHLRSLNGVDDTGPGSNGFATEGERVRFKRRAQAEYLANLIQGRQTSDPTELIITLGDMNAFAVNDGYVDSIGTIKGTPAPASQVTLASPDLVNPDLYDLVDLLGASQQYSYNFDGNAQTLDHIILNRKALVFMTRFFYARNDSDFAVKNYESTNELRISDHDQPVAYFNLQLAPTAANGTISGRIVDSNGGPVAGTVMQLSGSQTRRAITDAQGNYSFHNVETNGFYTVTPSRANYTFSPASKSFSLVGDRAANDFTGLFGDDNPNPLDVAEYFVRQQYLDMLGREPDADGFVYWSDQINLCGADSDCVSARRRDVAAAFFIEQEMQMTGSFVYGLYKGTLGRMPLYNEYTADRALVVGGSNLEARRQAFAEGFVRRAEFAQRYDLNTSAASFVDALVENLRQSSGVDLSNQRDSLIARYNSGSSQDHSRSLVVRDLTDNASFKQAEYNGAFVLSEYFSYLRRNPDARGYSFWLNVLNNGDPGNYRGMVCGFINSAEYQRRFSSVVSRSDNDCSR
jgi:uncharacterized protein